MYEENKTIPNKLLVFFTSILILFVTFLCFIFISVDNVYAKEVGRAFYGGQQVGTTFTFDSSGNNIAKWENLKVQTVRYDNDNLIMTSGKDYTFSAKFELGLTDSINATNTIQVVAGYLRSGQIYDFSSGSCIYDFDSKNLTPPIGNEKYYIHTISVNCKKISFSTGNNQLIVRFRLQNTNNDYYNNIVFSPSSVIFKDTNSLTDSDKLIINQNQNTQDIINNQNSNTDKITDSVDKNTESIDKNTAEQKETNDTINDTDTTGAQDTAGGFFDSFTTEDNGGISGIITAPLVAINQMLSQTCVDLSSTYKGKEFAILSGCEFWAKIPDVKEFLNIIEGGFLCYMIIRKLFYLVQRLKNPEDDRVEVMSL